MSARGHDNSSRWLHWEQRDIHTAPRGDSRGGRDWGGGSSGREASPHRDEEETSDDGSDHAEDEADRGALDV